MKRNKESWLVAVADKRETIDKHWNYLNNDLMPNTREMEDKNDVYSFYISKISGLATLEEGEEGKSEKKISSFHSTFDLPNERVVTCKHILLYIYISNSNSIYIYGYGIIPKSSNTWIISNICKTRQFFARSD
jgi:hypothetical protein